MAKAWRCGDCGSVWPMSVKYCRRPFDDYLSLRGGSIESAMELAIEKAVAPLVAKAERNLRMPHMTSTEALPFAIAA